MTRRRSKADAICVCSVATCLFPERYVVLHVATCAFSAKFVFHHLLPPRDSTMSLKWANMAWTWSRRGGHPVSARTGCPDDAGSMRELAALADPADSHARRAAAGEPPLN